MGSVRGWVVGTVAVRAEVSVRCTVVGTVSVRCTVVGMVTVIYENPTIL